MKPDRIDYKKFSLSEEDAAKDPVLQFTHWWQEAIRANIPMVDAVHLATVDAQNHPDSRVVLLKHFDDNGFVFFTNYQSPKAKELEKNPHACMSILWPELERQVRIRGTVKKTSRMESEEYFKTRPKEAQISAWSSPQSQVVSRKQLENFVLDRSVKFKDEVPCPPHWGGFRLVPSYFEFWQGRTNRLHDRISYSHEKTGAWTIQRLAP